MEKILQGIEGVTVYIDDILVTGRTDKQHLHTLEIVLERLHQYGLRLKRGKCSFMQPSVQYLGYVIDKEGIHTTPEKVQAILNSLSKAEKGYSQLEKEALSLIYGVKKYHQYLYGRRFLLMTDHKPLLTILGPKKQLPTLAAARLQRWALTLSAYQYDIQFRPTGEHCNADGFSRLPVIVSEPFQDVAPSSVFNLMQIAHLPVDADTLQKATRTDPLISHVVMYTLTGWPSTVEPELKPYWTKRMELSVEPG